MTSVLESPVYQKFEKWHDTYLGVASLNLFLLVAAVALIAHLLFVVPNQEEFKFGTIRDVVTGPGIALVVVGLLGVAIVLKELGAPQQLYVSLYTPFALLCIGVSAWSIFSAPDEVDRFQSPSIQPIGNWTWRQFATVSVVILAFLSFVVSWIHGNFRVDAIQPASFSMIILVIVAMLIAYGLSHVFSLALQTIESYTPESGDTEKLLYYALGTGVVLLLIVGTTKALDSLLSLFSGHIGHVGEDAPGTNASKAVVETMRAFRVAIYTLVVLTAALMWRRRKALTAKPDSDLSEDWGRMAIAFVVVPLLAFLSELVVGHLGRYPRVFEFLRMVTLAFAVLYIGTSFIPWNFLTLGLTGLVFVFLVLKLENPMHHRQRLLAVFVCAGLFVAGNYFFRGADRYQVVEMNSDGSWAQFLIWSFYLIIPAVGLLIADLTHEEDDPGADSFRHDLFRLYLSFIFFYTMSTFFFEDEGVPGIYSEMVPDNEAASLALDGVVLAFVLLLTTGVWGAAVPIDQMVVETPAKTFAYIAMGVVSSYMFINLRKEPKMIEFVQSSQKVAEEWYIKTEKDLNV